MYLLFEMECGCVGNGYVGYAFCDGFDCAGSFLAGLGKRGFLGAEMDGGWVRCRAAGVCTGRWSAGYRTAWRDSGYAFCDGGGFLAGLWNRGFQTNGG